MAGPWTKYQQAQASPASGPWSRYGAGSGVGGAVSDQLAMLERAANEQMILGNDAGYNSLMQQAFALRNDLKNGQTFIGGQMQPIPGANAGAYARSRSEAAGTAAGQVPTSVQEYQFAVSQGYQGDYQTFENDRKKAGSQSVEVKVGEGDKFYQTLDEANAKRWSAYSDAGGAARRNLKQIDRLESSLSAVETGGWAAVKQMAGRWGVKTEGLDDIQAASALISAMIPAQREPGSGPMSDKDIELFKHSLPSLINQPGGNAKIIATLRAMADYDMRVGDIADAVADRTMKPAEARRAMSELTNPLAGWGYDEPTPAAPAAAPGGMLAPPPVAPAYDVQDGVPVGAAREQVFTPKTRAEYDALPPGAVYIGRDGRRAQKK